MCTATSISRTTAIKYLQKTSEQLDFVSANLPFDSMIIIQVVMMTIVTIDHGDDDDDDHDNNDDDDDDDDNINSNHNETGRPSFRLLTSVSSTAHLYIIPCLTHHYHGFVKRDL